MSEIDQARTLVRGYLAALDSAAPGDDLRQAVTTCLAPDHVYRGVHPFDELTGQDAVADVVWSPLRQALGPLKRRLSIFIASHSHLKPDAPIWVVAMGQLTGLFDKGWLGIPATRKFAYVPNVSFFRVADGRIAETIEFLDILSVLDQAGLNPFAERQTAAQMMSPPPLSLDGVKLALQDEGESLETLDLGTAMLDDLIVDMRSSDEHLEKFWHSDMTWFGPTGIGACMGFKGYRRGHTQPFQSGLEFLEAHPEQCAVAEGCFSAYVWYPALTMRPTGGFLGLPASDEPAVMRIVDLYRRDGDKLAENWIFIDMLHFLKMQGVDLLADLDQGARPQTVRNTA